MKTKYFYLTACLLVLSMSLVGCMPRAIEVGRIKTEPPNLNQEPVEVTETPAQQTEQISQTATSEPIATADPNPPISLPFEESFDQALRSEWRVVGSEKPVLMDGRLTAVRNKRVTLEIGNASLKNYTIELDVMTRNKEGDLTIYFTPTLALEISPLLFNPSYLRWKEFVDNQWTIISDQRSDLLNNMDTFERLSIKRNGSSYEIYKDGVLMHTMVYGSEDGYPVKIQIFQNDIFIDRLVIR